MIDLAAMLLLLIAAVLVAAIVLNVWLTALSIQNGDSRLWILYFATFPVLWAIGLIMTLACIAAKIAK